MCDIPRSGKKVMEVLEDSEHHLSEIRERTGMPERTIRFAIRKLEDMGMVRENADLGDMRRKTFRLTGRKI